MQKEGYERYGNECQCFWLVYDYDWTGDSCIESGESK